VSFRDGATRTTYFTFAAIRAILPREIYYFRIVKNSSLLRLYLLKSVVRLCISLFPFTHAVLAHILKPNQTDRLKVSREH
jgi:hypothetical protein